LHISTLFKVLPKEKQVILNVDAHVYPLSKNLFKNLSTSLVVLQLGRWYHHDNKTYMEVDGLESSPDSMCAINKLKNIKYLSLRGLSRLSKLPCGIQKLKNLEILDMRGCQNLVTVETNDISSLKNLTHLDLTECYMLEHIGQGVASLPNLQVFKGFVFGLGTKGKARCQLPDLKKLKKLQSLTIKDLKKLKRLQKLTISITTDAYIRHGDMAELQHFNKLRSLTITWSEIPSILQDKPEEKRTLLKTWTSFVLPQGLVKLDVRCYPDKELKLDFKLKQNNNSLQKLYIRGGNLETFSIPKLNKVMTLRLRYLKKFNMTWDAIFSKLEKIEHVEIRIKDEKLLKRPDFNENDKEVLKNDIDESTRIWEKMVIPKSKLDENGVWMKDIKEVENTRGIVNQTTAKSNNDDAKTETDAQGDLEKSKGTLFNLHTFIYIAMHSHF
jgi:Leucine-rich repeat (LRR) protein